MKTKKMLSLLTAAAISISSFAAFAVTASAKDISKAEVDKIYKADELFDNPNREANEVAFINNEKISAAYDKMGKPFGDITSANYSKYADSDNAVGSLTYNISKPGAYTFYMLVYEYGNRYPTISIDGVQKFDGANYTDRTQYGTFKDYSTTTRGITIINIPVVVEDAGSHKISWQKNSSNYINGIFAAVLVSPPDAPPANKITITPDSATVKVDRTVTLKATVEPEGAIQTVTWTADDSGNASVDSNGVVTGEQAGVATITAKAADGSEVSAQVTIEVIQPTAPEPLPEGVKVYQYSVKAGAITAKGDNGTVKDGQVNTTTQYYNFEEEVDKTVKSALANKNDGEEVDPDLIGQYLSYIAGTKEDRPHPQLTIDNLPAGNYKMYYITGSSTQRQIQVSVNGGETLTLSKPTTLAKSTSGQRNLEIYEADFNQEEALSDATVTFDGSDQYLPDLYAVVILSVPEPEELEPETATAEPVSKSTGKDGNAAAAYTASFDGVDGKITKLIWTVTGTGDEAPATAEVTLDANTIVTNSDVVFGLIIEAENGETALNKIQDVTAALTVE